MARRLSGPQARYVAVRPGGPGSLFDRIFQGLKGRHKSRAAHVPPRPGGEICWATFSWGFTPGCRIAGLRPFNWVSRFVPTLPVRRRALIESGAWQAEENALKRLPAAAELEALLSAIQGRTFRSGL